MLVTGLHLEQGFCVRFPAEVDGEPLETWEDWDELEFLSEEGSVELRRHPALGMLPRRAKCWTTPRTAVTCTSTRRRFAGAANAPPMRPGERVALLPTLLAAGALLPLAPRCGRLRQPGDRDIVLLLVLRGRAHRVRRPTRGWPRHSRIERMRAERGRRRR